MSAVAVRGACGHRYVGRECPTCAERVRRVQRARQAGWITLQTAFDMVGLKASGGRGQLKGLPSIQLGGFPGRPPVFVRRKDIERVCHLMREAKLHVPAAVRVVVAEREGRI